MDEEQKARYGLGVGVSCWVSLFWVMGHARRGCPIYGPGREKSWLWRYLDSPCTPWPAPFTEPGDDTAELCLPGYALMSDIIYGGKQ